MYIQLLEVYIYSTPCFDTYLYVYIYSAGSVCIYIALTVLV